MNLVKFDQYFTKIYQKTNVFSVCRRFADIMPAADTPQTIRRCVCIGDAQLNFQTCCEEHSIIGMSGMIFAVYGV